MSKLSRWVVPLSIALATGCASNRVTTDTESSGDDGDDDGDGDDDDGDDGGEPGSDPITEVDVLFVVDNSGSMGQRQAKLTGAVATFVHGLDKAGLDYRIAVTTTDNGNIGCSGTSPEGGMFRLVSCRDREDEFTWPKVNPTVMDFDQACASSCPEEVSNAIEIQPTTTLNDSTARPRPWLERSIDGSTNVSGATMAEAIGCMLPQGVDGCGFEAQLESLYKAVVRSISTSENQFDFIRPNAILAIVVVSDEYDCSANEDHQAQVFDVNLPTPSKVFWEDPSSDIPTSAICWNGGVRCEGSPLGYDECRSENYDITGEVIESDAAGRAVLRPVDRYVDVLQLIEADKRLYNANQEVLFLLIGGVPEGYAELESDLVYAESDDPSYASNFGIGAGCVDEGVSTGQSAAPPVRMHEVADAFDVDRAGRNVSSICAPTYQSALQRLGEQIAELARG